MKSIAGAIVILAAAMLWSVAFVVRAIKDRSPSGDISLTYVVSAILGLAGVIVLFAGVVSKGEHRQTLDDALRELP
jgi:hypothetical protein